MGRQGTRRRIAKGIYADAKGFESMVMVAGVNRTKRFPLGTGIRVMEEWIFEQKVEIKTAVKTTGMPTVKTGTLAADAERYLSLPDVRAMPSFSDRERHVNWWVAQLGDKKRSRIRPDDVQRALETLTAAGKAGNTRNHHRTALRHLYRTLDGKHAANPAAEVKKAEDESAEDPKGRAIDPLTLARIIHRVEPASLSRVRLALLATCGVTNGEQKRLTKRSFVFGENQSGKVIVPPRRKGKGAPAREVPFMTVHAWRAAMAFVRAYNRKDADGNDAWGKEFSNSSLNTSFHRAADHVRQRYRDQGMDEDAIETLIRPDAKPYDLRHTFGTFVAAQTKDDTVAQTLLGHRSMMTTQRYTRASVPDRVAAVVAKTHKRQRKAADAEKKKDDLVFRYVVETPTLKIVK